MRSIWTRLTLTNAGLEQCDQKKSHKSPYKLPKNDYTIKIKDFDTFTKIA